MTNKGKAPVAVVLYVTDELDTELARRAAKADCSKSTVLEAAWRERGKKLAKVAADSDEVQGIKQDSPTRDPLVHTVLKKMIVANEPAAPPGLVRLSIFLRAETAQAVERECERLGLATWEALAWCVQ